RACMFPVCTHSHVTLQCFALSLHDALPICFPVWSRNRQDYDLAIYVANWPSARELHWNRLLQARAIENLSYVAGVNRIGVDEKQQHYAGDSSIYGPDGVELLQAKAASGCFIAELSSQRLQEYRTAFPAHLDADNFTLDDR